MAQSRGLIACQTCSHPSAVHEPVDERPCRINPCGCPGFYSPEVRIDEDIAAQEQAKAERGVFLVIPNGYEMTVTLRPLYLVGERGPEMFVPAEPGVVVPEVSGA